MKLEKTCCQNLLGLAFFAIFAAPSAACSAPAVVTQMYNNAHTSWNPNETNGSFDVNTGGVDYGEGDGFSTPLGGRFGQPAEIAPVVVFLASDDAAWVTGERISGSGGMH
jgi:NAD(P)-dependent dehydrogenase (short-subunit alcohol dehydrogenase family)